MIALLLLRMRTTTHDLPRGVGDAASHAQGLDRFAKWRAAGSTESFAARLLTGWLQRQYGCSKRSARLAMKSLPGDSTLSDLIASVGVFDSARRRPGRRSSETVRDGATTS